MNEGESATTPNPQPSVESVPTPIIVPLQTTVAPATTPVPAPSDTPVPQADPVQFMMDGDAKPGRGHGKLIAILVSIFIVLLGGGGAFAAVSTINNDPANILKGSVGNLINAKQVAISGTLDVSSSITSVIGVSSIGLDFNSLSADSNQSSTVTLKVKFVDGTELSTISLSEIMLVDGVFYIKLDGLRDLYNIYHDTIEDYLTTSLTHEYEDTRRYEACATADSVWKCREEHQNDKVEADTKAITQATDYILSGISDIIDMVDGNWQRISMDEMMESELAKSLDPIMRQGIISAHKCSVDTLASLPDYTDDFITLYDQHPFVTLTSSSNSFYDVSIDSDSLASYINSVAELQFFQDFAKCNSAISDTSSITPNITPDDISRTLTYFPTISAKFDGFLDHHLTDLRLTKNSDYYNLAADLHFTYPTDITVSTPDTSAPIMDLIQGITDTVTSLQPTTYF